MSVPRVFLTGGDGVGWALDDDLARTARALEGLVEPATLEDCDVIHSLWWDGVLSLPDEDLVGKRIICHVPGEPYRYMSIPRHRRAMARVGRWITQTRQAEQELMSFGVRSTLIPYTVDTAVFCPVRSDDPRLVSLRERWNVPQDRYLIGSFQRDTESRDLRTPKLVKGPDVFCEIVAGLRRLGHPIHVLLAGPRRHWVRAALGAAGVPFTFVGQVTEGDDLSVNTLPREMLGLLYNLIDMCLISSRSEGGPHAILEASAAGRKVVARRVGLAEDVLEPGSIYDAADEAVELVGRDIGEGTLSLVRNVQRERVLQCHTVVAVTPLFRGLYERVHTVEPYRAPRRVHSLPFEEAEPRERTRVWSLSRHISVGKAVKVAIWHEFHRPPWGGGNQFMLTLRRALESRGFRVADNVADRSVDVCLLNSIHFDVERFLASVEARPVPVVHRIDGPIQLIRGFDEEKDALCFRLNSEVAVSTVLQSAWSYARIVELGFRPVCPTVIHNAVDPRWFHPRRSLVFDRHRKVRLVSTSWSGHARKGGAIYKWLDENLDWSRYEYTLVGNASESFQRIQRIPAVGSSKLARILRSQDIYVTASQNDPCSNALIEALACGLPALCLRDGGHPELLGLGGLTFEGCEDLTAQLDRMVDNYEMFQRLIAIPTIEDVAGKYAELLREAVLTQA